jgi:hypothetical protein
MFIKRLIRSALAAFDKQVKAKKEPQPLETCRHYYMNYKEV